MKNYIILISTMIFSLSSFGQNVVPKTNSVIDGEGYSNFGVYQRIGPIPEYVLCDMSDCPRRTTKTIIEAKSNTQVPSQLESSLKVYFAFNSSQLTQESQQNLIQQLENLKTSKNINLRGWTDPVGGRASIKNTNLAKARTESVQTFLQSNGITATFNSTFEPPCCTNSKATKNSTDKVRRLMRYVEISY